MADADFNAGLLEVLPRLQVYALSLTRNRDAADDLVQDTMVKALAGRQSFQPGTNLAAWLFRIQRNEFISATRRPANRAHANIDDVSIPQPPRQDAGIRTRELVHYLKLLPRETRQILLLSGLNDSPYEDIACRTGLTVGTVKSRVSRARDLLDGAL